MTVLIQPDTVGSGTERLHHFCAALALHSLASGIHTGCWVKVFFILSAFKGLPVHGSHLLRQACRFFLDVASIHVCMLGVGSVV